MRPQESDRAPKKRKTLIHEEAIAALYRLRGLGLAIKFIFDPLADNIQDVDRIFAVRSVAEAMDRDIDVLMEAADEPNPVFVLRTEGDDEGDNHEA